jgi:hypothetical protein
MSYSSDKLEQGLKYGNETDSTTENKTQAQELDGSKTNNPAPSRLNRASEMPECIRHMSVEEREQAELKLRQKIDLRLMPMIILMYIMNYLDRNNIAAAKLAGILTDLHLKGVEFQVGPSVHRKNES